MDRNFEYRIWKRGQDKEPESNFETDKEEYQCKRCHKLFESVAYKTDKQAACPFCPGVGERT